MGLDLVGVAGEGTGPSECGLGCPGREIFGQDLALEDGALYGSSDPDQAAGEGHTSDTLSVPGYYGDEVTTT